VSDLILFNANVITLDSTLPKAQWIAIKDGKITHVSGFERLHELRQRNTELIDCHGKTVIPGFIDTHFHLHGFAESLIALNLSPRNNVHSISDIQARIRQETQRLSSGSWIRGRGYNEFYLAEKRHPNRWDLDAVTLSHPVKLTHRSTRAHVLSSLGLRLANISRETPDPPEGLIDRDETTGEPTGLLYGMSDYLAKTLPHLGMDQMEQGIRLAGHELNSLGITSIHDASSRNNLNRWKLFTRWKEEGILKTRMNVALGIGGFREYLKKPFLSEIEKNQLAVRGVKIIVHETTGRLAPSQEELNELVLEIHRSGLQVILHAIEEKTIEAACSAIEHALVKLPKLDHRHRIEHCSVCTPSLAKRLASLGIMVVTQPSFIYYNGDRYLKTVPNHQLNHLYPLTTLMKNGVKVVGSSDGPIVPANPLIGIYSTVSRRTEQGEFVLPEEGASPLEALRMYTENGARTTFQEMIKGSITLGKLADLVVLSGDPIRLPVDKIKDIEVEMTILNGEVVWRRDD
jgi:predicted amidohydrolase YtcJ